MCYLYAKSQNKQLFLRDTKNNISDSFHLILDTFQEPPGVTYTTKNGITLQQLSGPQMKTFFDAYDIDLLRSEAKKIFKLQPAIQKKISVLLKGLPIPVSKFDLGIHIRTGDKITSGEMTKIPLEYYLKSIIAFQKVSGKEKLALYLMTDSKTVQAYFKKNADPSWAVVFLPPPIASLDGHFQNQYNSHSVQLKMDAYIHFLAELQIMQSCPIVFCTFSSNIGRYIYLTGGDDVRSLDVQFEL